MKKRLFAVLVGMLLCCNIFAQKEPGTLTLYPRVGLNLSKFSGDKIYRESFDYVKSKFKSGLVIGAEMQYQMAKNTEPTKNGLEFPSTRNCEDAGSIPGLAQPVRDLVLP